VSRTVLGMEGSLFTVNGKPAFLTGISYYGALGAPREFIEPVTASEGGDIDRDSLRTYLQKVQVSFVCPHRPRNAASPRQTEARTREYLQWVREEGQTVPVHYQEPFRRGYGQWQPVADDFLTDLRGAKEGGATEAAYGETHHTLSDVPHVQSGLAELVQVKRDAA